MKIVNEKLLDKYRGPGKCDWCGKKCKAREPHHYRAKGMGGGARLDIDINLIALGASKPFPECNCHLMIHSGEIERFSVLAVIAAREGQSQDWITDEINRILSLDRDGNPPRRKT